MAQTHKLALANGQITEVHGEVRLKDGGILDVSPVDGNAYFISPSGWWSWEPIPEGDTIRRE